MHHDGLRKANGLPREPLTRVRQVRCLRSIFWVCCFPTVMGLRTQTPLIHASVIGVNRERTKGRKKVFDGKKTDPYGCRTRTPRRSLSADQLACHHQRCGPFVSQNSTSRRALIVHLMNLDFDIFWVAIRTYGVD